MKNGQEHGEKAYQTTGCFFFWAAFRRLPDTFLIRNGQAAVRERLPNCAPGRHHRQGRCSRAPSFATKAVLRAIPFGGAGADAAFCTVCRRWSIEKQLWLRSGFGAVRHNAFNPTAFLSCLCGSVPYAITHASGAGRRLNKCFLCRTPQILCGNELRGDAASIVCRRRRSLYAAINKNQGHVLHCTAHDGSCERTLIRRAVSPKIPLMAQAIQADHDEKHNNP